MKFDASHRQAILDLLRWRRDVRHFTDEPVADESVAVLKQAMTLAPSVGNSRPWRVVSVESSGVRQQIIANHKSANIDAAGLYQGEQYQAYCALKLAALEVAPVQLAVFTEVNPGEGHGLGRQTMPETLAYSTVLAIHSLWLAARSLNLGVGWVSILDPNAVIQAVDVESNWHLTAYLCIGHPKYADDTPELERKDWQQSIDADWLIR